MLKRPAQRQAELTCTGCGSSIGTDFAFCPRCGLDARYPSPAEVDQELAGIELLFTGSDPQPAPEPQSGTSGVIGRVRGHVGRHRRAAVAVIVAIALTVGSAIWGYGYMRDRPARAALNDALSAVQPINDQLAAAQNLSDLQAVAREYGAVQDELERAQTDLSQRSGDLAQAAESLVAAERTLATAGATLTGVTSSDFTAWVEVRSDLLEAVDAVEEARGQLDQVDADLADDASLDSELVPNVQGVVGQVVLGSSAQDISGMFEALSSATETAALREVAADASAAEAAVTTVMDGFEASTPEHERLETFIAVYSAVAELSIVDGDHLAEWAGVRGGILESMTVLQPVDKHLGTLARESVRDVDALVEAASRKLRAWRNEYESAARAKRQAIEQFESYQDGMTAQLDRYSSLRASLSDWIDRVENPRNFVTYDEAYDVLWRAESDRWAVRDKMNKLSVPSQLSASHNALVAVIDDAIGAVTAAYEGAFDSQYCNYSCYYADTPGWQRFQSESSRITDAFSQAVADWERAMKSTESTIRGQKLPQRPVV